MVFFNKKEIIDIISNRLKAVVAKQHVISVIGLTLEYFVKEILEKKKFSVRNFGEFTLAKRGRYFYMPKTQRVNRVFYPGKSYFLKLSLSPDIRTIINKNLDIEKMFGDKKSGSQ